MVSMSFFSSSRKGSPSAPGSFLGVVDADRAHHLILLHDVCAQLPRCLFEVLGPALLSFESDLGHADFRELPSRRDGLNDTIANLIDVRVGLLQSFLDGIETRELLGPLGEVF